jgi:hypothetical protein
VPYFRKRKNYTILPVLSLEEEHFVYLKLFSMTHRLEETGLDERTAHTNIKVYYIYVYIVNFNVLHHHHHHERNSGLGLRTCSFKVQAVLGLSIFV